MFDGQKSLVLSGFNQQRFLLTIVYIAGHKAVHVFDLFLGHFESIVKGLAKLFRVFLIYEPIVDGFLVTRRKGDKVCVLR